MNQCDGCVAGKPLDDRGNHVMGEPGGYRDVMACQRYRYVHSDYGDAGNPNLISNGARPAKSDPDQP